MEAFPFSQSEWQKVEDASHLLVNATLENDTVLKASYFAELLAVLDELRRRHGDHPTLLETAADFCDDPSLRVDTYRSAIKLAEANNLPTLSIRISLAEVLLKEFRDASQAAGELAACESELAANADESVIREWSGLMKQCGREMEHQCPGLANPNNLGRKGDKSNY